MPAETKIERAEQQRDLRSQISGLDRADQQEIIFKETSPRRKKTRIYHMRNGQPADVPEYIAMKALDKIDPETGQYMFTASQSKAPEFKMGTVLCFLHEDAPDRPVLEELGLTVPCRKATLANPHAKRMHAMHRHPQEWEAYQDFLKEGKEARAEERQQQQIDATLALAEKAVQADNIQCPDCDYTGTAIQIRGHMKVHNKVEAATP